MDMAMTRRYPIGIQTFSNIREGNYLYIDKTEYIYRLSHSAPKYIFLGRPRRFGKSLLTSTLRCYFEGRKELFKGLAIEQLEKEWTEYPVLHFDLSTARHSDTVKLEQEIERQLLKYEEIYDRGIGDININQRLQGELQHQRQEHRKLDNRVANYEVYERRPHSWLCQTKSMIRS